MIWCRRSASCRHSGKKYHKVEDAIHAVRGCGYGVVIPGREEIQLEEPAVIHRNKYGVKIKSVSPSIHMIKANIETEIAPIVGSEQQAEDLIAYIKRAHIPAIVMTASFSEEKRDELLERGLVDYIIKDSKTSFN